MWGEHQAGRVGSGGYTVAELATVLALIGIASALAWPSLAGLRRGREVERAATELLYTLRLAHSRAVLSGKRVRVTLRPGVDGRQGLLVESESDGGWAAEGPWRPLPPGVALQVAGAPTKTFNPNGTSSAGGYTIAGAGPAYYRCTLTPATGRVRFYRGGREAARAR